MTTELNQSIAPDGDGRGERGGPELGARVPDTANGMATKRGKLLP
eukprot:CAMPEP_0113540940 /NCGR_PEP_ID=MMETSP0015_2-20120614/8754_1 /TAXON_ID=2838 /ORGANISM="Odontella" /LENGTH=44 /DNA_ID=CAMNT_0000440789 /DNA_START=626 /DNA_END=760 /DNA_ORIENTATION=- /assembly_acc=CAM_ASM_000160